MPPRRGAGQCTGLVSMEMELRKARAEAILMAIHSGVGRHFQRVISVYFRSRSRLFMRKSIPGFLYSLISASLLLAQAPTQIKTGSYQLDPDDVIVIRVLEAEEISEKPVRVDPNGNISLPMVGTVHAGGLSLEEVGAAITKRLQTYFKHPQVSVSITEFRTQPVSVFGQVAQPGVQQVRGRKTLVEILSLAGGVKEDAGPIVNISRQMKWGVIPVAGAVVDPTGQVSVAQVKLKNIVNVTDGADNILILPQDVITIPRADIIYVIGEVQRPGAFVLRERDNLSLLQALSMAGGLGKLASNKHCRILRMTAGNQEREQIPVDISRVLSGKDKDAPLHADDILFVPNSVTKTITVRGAEAAISVGTGLAIYHY
jgi:polysaccharide biosynthesis/export protein